MRNRSTASRSGNSAGPYQPTAEDSSSLTTASPPTALQRNHTVRYWQTSPCGYLTSRSTTPATRSTTMCTPVSSYTSRTTASAGCSPGSTAPAGRDHAPVSARRPRRTRPLSSMTTAHALGTMSKSVPTCLRSPATYSEIAIARAYPCGLPLSVRVDSGSVPTTTAPVRADTATAEADSASRSSTPPTCSPAATRRNEAQGCVRHRSTPVGAHRRQCRAPTRASHTEAFNSPGYAGRRLATMSRRMVASTSACCSSPASVRTGSPTLTSAKSRAFCE